MEKRFKEWKKPIIEEGELTKWNWMAQNVDKLFLGKNIDIGAFCYLNALNGLYIYDNVKIGSHCSLYTISTIDSRCGNIIIRKGAKIGSHSTIMPNVEIGENAVIGAHSFVKSNTCIPPNSLWYGIPARRRDDVVNASGGGSKDDRFF